MNYNMGTTIFFHYNYCCFVMLSFIMPWVKFLEFHNNMINMIYIKPEHTSEQNSKVC